MANSIKALFTEHPADVGETYFEHMLAALGFSMRLFLAGLASLVHALLPFLCIKTGSTIIQQLYDKMVINRSKSPANPHQQK